MINDRRFGRFTISAKDLTKPYSCGTALGIMRFIPLKVEYLYYKDALDCTGWSPMFEYVNEGEAIPEYAIHLKSDSSGNIVDVKVKKYDT